MVNELKLKAYIVMVPPVFAVLPAVIPKYPAPGESYNHKQMVDVLTIFDKRWKAAGSPADREPYALSSSKDGIVENTPVRLTHDQIYSELAATAYIEAVAEKESSNLLLKELLSLDNSLEGDPDDIDSYTEPHGGGEKCETKTTKTRARSLSSKKKK
jgi:hypothetical protein